MSVNDIEKTARYEVKFATNNGHYDYLKQWVEVHKLGFYSPYSTRQVNNIYFDSHDLDSYLENMAGVSSRTKLRLRWYGATDVINGATLELKLKRNKLGWKKSAKVDLVANTRDLSFDALREHIHGCADENLLSRFAYSDHPVLINSYERDYFVSYDDKVRITIDRGMRFFDQRSSWSPNIDFHCRAAEVIILEVKTAAKDLDKASRVLRGMPIPPTRSSKYVIGVQSALGY